VRATGHQVTELNPEMFRTSGLFRRTTNAPAAGGGSKP
jgi:hypothetical protein